MKNRILTMILPAVAAMVMILPASAKNKPSPVAVSLEEYVRQAKASQPVLQTAEGSLYTDGGYNSDLYGDMKARRIDDIVTIRIEESTVAESNANSQTARKSTAALTAPNLFGLERNNPNFPFANVVNASSDTQFKGDGTTKRSGTVSAFLSARVRDVLPNGNMVIEGIKEVKVNNERQMLALYGVVRPKDIGPNNMISSTSIANMMVQIDGKGLLSDNLKPGWLFRILTKVWPF